MEFRLYEPIPALKGAIEKIWVFESEEPLPNDDMKLIVPNGRLLLLVPFHNALVGKKDGKTYIAENNRIALVGISDKPSVVDSLSPGTIGTIGVEINPTGAYLFFHMKLGEIKNRLNYLSDLPGGAVKNLEQKMSETINIDEKVRFLQGFLHSRMLRVDADPLFEYCIHQIQRTRGGIQIKKLEQETGYSRRWLNMKFKDRLGMSPKNLCSIIRFQQYYQALLSNNSGFFTQKKFYDHYYDESHFIKEFKKYTCLSPSRLIRSKNDFGGMFYDV